MHEPHATFHPDDALLLEAWRCLPDAGDRARWALLYAAAGRAVATVGRGEHRRMDEALTHDVIARVVTAAQNNPDFGAANRRAANPVAAIRTYLNAVARSVLTPRASLKVVLTPCVEDRAPAVAARTDEAVQVLLGVVVAEAEKVLVDDDPEVGPRGKLRRRAALRERVAVAYGLRRVEDLVPVPRSHPDYSRARNAVDQRFKRLMVTLNGVLARRSRWLGEQKAKRVERFVDSLRLYGGRDVPRV